MLLWVRTNTYTVYVSVYSACVFELPVMYNSTVLTQASQQTLMYIHRSFPTGLACGLQLLVTSLRASLLFIAIFQLHLPVPSPVVQRLLSLCLGDFEVGMSLQSVETLYSCDVCMKVR